jgi:glycine/D-amino acid oxidase-like deaminating enzyme
VIGLSTAFELGRAGTACRLYGVLRHEAGSGAAAGLLAPSIGNLSAVVREFFTASLARYPDFVAELRAFEPELSLVEGLLDVSTQPSDRHSRAGNRLSSDEVAALDPSVAAPHGAVFHPRDAAVDNRLLVAALRRAVASLPAVTMVDDDAVVMIDLSGTTAALRTRGGSRVDAERIVLAAGAWSATIEGLPRRIPVRPLKGQMLAVGGVPLRHAVMGDDIYLVPRASEIAIGATVEDVGFDVTVIPESIETLRQSAVRVCPALRDAPVIRTWAGIRPATPDMLPILGAEPLDQRLIYACGHSKNGILLAPATALAVAAIAGGRSAPFDLTPFRPDRFPSD